MKKILSFALFVFAFLPLAASAHGGIEKIAGGSYVFLKQNPLSPLVGEKTLFSFALADLSTNKPLANVPVSVTLTDTFYGDESKDEIVFTKKFTTDVNGNFEFSHTFDKENYFDIDIAFDDPATGREQSTGFLVQTRGLLEATATESREEGKKGSYEWAYLVAGVIVGAGAMFGLGKTS